jgi:serine/threonine protein kinase
MDRIQYNTHLPEVQRFTQKYYLKRTLVRGQFNAVASGYNKITHQKVVIKSIYNPGHNKVKEISILKKLQHVPGIIKYLDDYAIKSDIHFIEMEYFGQMSLQFFLTSNGPVSENVAHTIFKQLFNTTYSCFQKHILHRKLKPSNIIINIKTNQVKIANFNSASQFDSKNDELNSPLNNDITPPEYFQYKKYTADGLYTWSLGLILYALLFNIKPFNSPSDIINTPLIIVPHNQHLSIDVIVLLKWILDKSDRISLNQLAHHPWITKQWI